MDCGPGQINLFHAFRSGGERRERKKKARKLLSFVLVLAIFSLRTPPYLRWEKQTWLLGNWSKLLYMLGTHQNE